MKETYPTKTAIVIGIICSIAGYALLYTIGGWKLCLAILLMTIGNNIDEKYKRKKEKEDAGFEVTGNAGCDTGLNNPVGIVVFSKDEKGNMQITVNDKLYPHGTFEILGNSKDDYTIKFKE